MTIAFFSNFMNHHQLPLCKALMDQPNLDFVFIASMALPEEQRKVGYDDMNQLPFVIRAYESKERKEEAMRVLLQADIAILGAADSSTIQLRMNTGKLTFRYCERLLKRGTWRRFLPHTRLHIYRDYVQYKNSSLYVLGASAYTAHDLVKCGFPIEKCLTWGYFPELSPKEPDEILAQKKTDKLEIVFAGRLMGLKNVIHAVKAVHKVIQAGGSVHFTIIGDGESKTEIEQYIAKNQLQEAISLHPFMNHKEVITAMEKATVFVFCSNFYEGWGAVVNEAMSSMCVVISSHAVGSAGTLIRHEENGLLYAFGDIEDLARQIKKVADNAQLTEKLKNNAYNTVRGEWSAEEAATRFVNVCQKIMKKSNWRGLYAKGPCSPALDFDNDWFRKNK